MAKTATEIWNAVAQAAGGTTTGDSQDLSDAEAAELHLRITNGATGPTLPAQVQIETSPDGSDWYDYGGPLKGKTANAGISEWTVPIDRGVKYARVVGSGNTGQGVTLDAWIVVVT